MDDRFLAMSFFIIFFPLIYLNYQCLKAFDYQKILRRDKVTELKILMVVVSVGFAFLVAFAFVSVLEHITAFF